MITPERLSLVQASIDKLVAQGQALYVDIRETTEDRARLIDEADQRERVIERLNADLTEAREQIVDLEARNGHLVDDIVRLESLLADATTRLDSISLTARRDLAPPSTPQFGVTDRVLRLRGNGEGNLS